MKFIRIAVITVLYGLLFHGAIRATSALFGPLEVDPAAAVQWRGIGYTALATLVAAAICTALWRWRVRPVPATEAWAAGGLAIILIQINILRARGLDGWVASVTERPLHTVLTYAVTFLAIPLCVLAANRFLSGGPR